MPDPRFFSRSGPFALRTLAERLGARIVLGASSDPAAIDRLILDVAPLDRAGPDEITFLDNPKYKAALAATKAGAAIVRPSHADAASPATVLLLCEDPYRAYALCARLFYPMIAATTGISPASHIHPDAAIAPGAQIAPGAVIERGARIGRDVRVDANAVIGAHVVIGEGCWIGACASLSHCLIGDRVMIYPGARIGQDGFGFAMSAAGHLRVPQLGRVIIEDDVEVGANAAIDRGSGPDTVIGRGAMIDNLVQIGHNVIIGPGCVIVAQVGLSGSVVLGRGVVLAGQVGVAGHLRIGDGARIAAQSGVMRDVGAGEEVFGTPAQPKRQYFQQIAMLARWMKARHGQGDDERGK
jgi:UDP-3-O-[3-hydroxymyristoyl] glucosamine N-acyltransferase